MNEQAIIDSYNLFVQNGYKKSLQDYKQLISSNPEALNDSYGLFRQNGYAKSLDDYKTLVGVGAASSAAQQKKNEDTTAFPSAVGSSVSSVSAEPKLEVDSEAIRFGELASKINQPEAKRVDEEGYIDPRSMLGMYPAKEQADKATTQAMADIDATKGERKQPAKGGGKGYVENLFTNVGLGAAYFNEGIASIPESAINLLAIPQNFVAEKTGWDIGVTADGIKESWGITNPLLDYVQEDKKILNGEVSKFIAERYEDPSVVGNFQKGNYKDGFELLGSAIAQSVPTSIGLMVGGAKMTPAQLSALSTMVFTEGQRQELAEMDPTMPEAEKTFKALSMAAMEGVFSSIGTGTIGKVYKDILKKEGAEAAPKILKDGLVAAYTKALEKTGPVAGLFGNAIEETATQISQNIISGKPAFEGAADAFVIGGGQGVVFTAPIGAINAKRYVQGKVESYQTKDKIGKILGDKADDIDNLYNVPVASEITTQQLEISNLPKSREILVNRLKKGVADSKITEDDAKQSLFVFDKIQQVSNAVKDLDIPVEDKAKVATLLTQRDDIKTKIQNKDDVLVVQEKKKIEDINIQIQEILSKPKQEAPSYKVGGIDVTTDVIDNLLKTKSKEELLAMNIEIINDPEGRVEKFQAIINPQAEVAPAAAEEVALKRRDRIQEIVKILDDNSLAVQFGTSNQLPSEEVNKLISEATSLKAEEDAFQKQAAGQVPVQSGATVSQEVAQGEPQAEPQGVAKEGQAQEVESKSIAIGDKVLDSDGVEYEVVGLVTSRKGTPQAEVKTSKRTDAQIQEDARRNVFSRNENRILYKDSNDPKFIKEQSIAISQEVSDLTAVNNSSQGSTTLDLEGLKKAEPQVTAEAGVQEEVVPATDKKGKADLPELNKELSKLFKKSTQLQKKFEKTEDPKVEAELDKVNEQLALLSAEIEAIESETPTVSRTVSPAPETTIAVSPTTQEEVVSSETPTPTAQPSTAPITIEDIKVDFNPNNAVEVQKGTREDTRGGKVSYNAAITSTATDNQGSPIGTITKRSDGDGKLSFTLKDSKGQNINKGKSYPTQRDAVTALAEQVNKVRAKATPVAAPAPIVAPSPEPVVAPAPEPVVAPEAEPILVDDQSEPILVTAKEIKSNLPKFTRDNAIEYDTDYKEDSMGRDVEYTSSLTVEALDVDGVEIGTITKLIDDEKNATYTAQDLDRVDVGRGKEYDSEAEVIKALTDHINKKRKKEFDKEVAKIVKEREKAAAKVAAKEAKAQAKQKAKQTSAEVEQVINLEQTSPELAERALAVFENLDKQLGNKLKRNANDALLAIPLTTLQAAVKAVKVLIKGGMAVRDAIRRVAAENNISQDKLKDLLNLIPIQEEFNALMTKADKMIARQKSRRIPEKKIVSNLDTMVRDFYKDMNVNDAQRKIMEREARARMGVEPRKAASIGRVIGVLKDITNVTREEKLKIIGRIRELGRDVAKDLAAEIRAMAKGGTITANQSADIIARFGKVNMLNEISVSNFVDYMAKVFANAEYVSQLETAKSTRKKLRSLSKDKKKSANLRDLAAKFVEIDPTMVEDIAAYNEVAKKIKESVEGSSIKGKDVKFADIVKEGIVTPYIDETLKAQNEKLYQERLKEAKDILGIDAKDLSYDELLVLLSKGKEKEKKQIRFSFENIDTNKLMNSIINAFDVYSSILESAIRTGVDPFTGEKVTYTESQKKLISEFIKMDLNILPQDQALEAVDSLLNFVQNSSTAKMQAILDAYTGEKNARGLVEKGVRASALRKYFSPGLARFFGEQTTNLGLLFERLFKGFEAGGVVQDAMGLTKLINGKSQAQNESNRIINDYVNEFYKKKANNEAFNTELNNVERGMASFMMRNVIGTAAQMKAEFKRRKDLIKESIEELSNGNEKEVAKSLIYQDVYDKILKDANTIDDVTSKVDAVNLNAVKFWQDQWQSKYDELADVSLNVYNKVLDKDVNYTPDRYGRLSSNSETVEITENDMAFNVNNGTLYDKETGVLMEATKPDALPADRFIDLSFDSNNANSMYDALVDIKTAGPIRQVQAFLNSKSFKKIFPNAEDAVILKGSKKDKRIGRIELFTRNFRNKNPYSEDEFSAAVRNLNRLANVGVSQALGGVFQPVKQVIPAAMNTLINGGSLDFNAMTNPDKIKFMMDSGYAIGFRGVESQAQIDSLNKLMDMAAKSKGAQAIKYIEQANNIWLKVFLVKPDVFIARASWMTYYEQSLAKQGVDTNGIDYKTHKLNEKAANYAQRMLDRQQNVSDADLSGKLFSEKNPGKQIMMKVFMPFASFRMNQSARLGADFATITSKVSTEEDRKIAARSLAGFAVETATFKALSLGISLLTTSLVATMMGSDEEDEEKKKNAIIKGQATNTVSDIFSPIPFTDPIVQAIAATTLQSAQDLAGVDEEDMISLYSPQDKGYLEQIGLFGFAAQRAVQTGELVWMSSVGSYRDSYGKKKYVSDDDKDALRWLIAPALLTNVGLAPSEMNSVVRASMSAAKKNSSTKEGGSTSGKDYESQMLDVIEENLLEGYENKTELKRYNPRLYEQNFGEGSEYYELTKEKRAEEKKAREKEQEEKDAEYGYRGKSKGFGSKKFGGG